MSESGTSRTWDHEDCPIDECDGELQQQDAYNVMCLSCECVWTHTKSETTHRLRRVDGSIADEKPIVAVDGGTPESVKEQEIQAEFVREEAVPVDEAESFVHLGIDDHYHPTGGYWFPTGKKWGESTGWVSRKYDIPRGELIQFPCDDREPEIRGRDDLSGWVVNRYVETGTDGGQEDE